MVTPKSRIFVKIAILLAANVRAPKIMTALLVFSLWSYLKGSAFLNALQVIQIILIWIHACCVQFNVQLAWILQQLDASPVSLDLTYFKVNVFLSALTLIQTISIIIPVFLVLVSVKAVQEVIRMIVFCVRVKISFLLLANVYRIILW
jgi:hypothetical protein